LFSYQHLSGGIVTIPRRDKLLGLLRAGDPHGDVAAVWQAKAAARELFSHGDPDLPSSG
jgi:hypothetical protein